MNIKGLLIDIDDTLIRFHPNINHGASSLTEVLRRAGKELGGVNMRDWGGVLLKNHLLRKPKRRHPWR